jgi:hypothetical protein
MSCELMDVHHTCAPQLSQDQSSCNSRQPEPTNH